MCCFRGRWIGWLGVGLIGAVLAEGTLPEPALRDRTVRLQEAALTAPRPAWLEAQTQQREAWRHRLQAEALLPRPTAPALSPSAVGASPGSAASSETFVTVPTLKATLLVSRALGESALRELFTLAAGRPDVRLVFRGVAPDESLADFIRGLHHRLRGAAQDADAAIPTVELDPRAFQTPTVDLAPTLIVTNGAGEELARVTGLNNPDWLLERVRRGERGDLGVRGPVVAISEPDLIEELPRRLATIDWDAKREAALARYWERTPFPALPRAETVRERRLDLTVTARADVVLPDGTRVIKAGARINPLDVLPFRQRLFIFDASDPRQVADVARRGPASRAEGRLPLYLATQLDRQAGWEGFRAVQAAVGESLYRLTPDVQARFGIERVPSRVDTRDGVFVVTEWPPED
ncbi:TrbC family F-type conjugative pilus assembly protein [Thiocystis violacea]|uniref:TrbC family F-type conjugative pilus assembly protein n=1 Tax=Thiocystis violacea TaxID=13725 RepID=UPI0019064D35|nr:TrbC family F-type conjugative pilus assembly protein [Thiocystis violacea]MBK1717307.1 conjugal transfer protein TrbC [Thiocystis violacea]